MSTQVTYNYEFSLGDGYVSDTEDEQILEYLSSRGVAPIPGEHLASEYAREITNQAFEIVAPLIEARYPTVCVEFVREGHPYRGWFWMDNEERALLDAIDDELFLDDLNHIVERTMNHENGWIG